MQDKSPGSEPSSDPTNAPDGSVQPLSYETPADRRHDEQPTNPVGNAIRALVGVVIATGATAFLGAFVYLCTGGLDSLGQRHGQKVAGASYIMAFLGFGWLTYIFYKRSAKGIRNWWIIGLLIGVGVTCLLEGMCFFSGA